MVVEALVKVGEHEHARELAADAERIARTITDLDEQTEALITIAESADLPQAGRLLGEAFALGSWLGPLSALAKVFPQEAIRFVDAVYAGEPGRGDR